ncbi:uncharacterized protein [Manis javanica]|uniref:uncharacterized protein n=1 Tax=Manis javanica TaxID=9974 RepID=UPI00187978E2|nr:uncharacterized protein LOC118973317 [Manis javanica]
MRRSQEKLRKLSGHGACLTLNEREGRKKAWWKHLRPQHSPKKKFSKASGESSSQSQLKPISESVLRPGIPKLSQPMLEFSNDAEYLWPAAGETTRPGHPLTFILHLCRTPQSFSCYRRPTLPHSPAHWQAHWGEIFGTEAPPILRSPACTKPGSNTRPRAAERETPPAAAAFRIHLKSSVDSAQGSVGAANANQVYNHQHGRGKKKRKKIICKFSSPHAQSHGRTHSQTRAHKRKEGVGGRARQRKGRCLQNAALSSAPVARALGEGAREARPGVGAMMVAADRGLFWRGSCNDAIPRPASRLHALLLPFLNVPLEAHRRFAPSTRRYFSVFFYFPIPAHSACVPTRDRPGARVAARDWSLHLNAPLSVPLGLTEADPTPPHPQASRGPEGPPSQAGASSVTVGPVSLPPPSPPTASLAGFLP